jgi:glycerophosphoryl diester phosphodiesterase
MSIPPRLETYLLQMIDALVARRRQPPPARAALHNCRIVSHRGEHDNRRVFENTIAAFDAALRQGVWGIELDVRWTRDLQAVVHHDADLKRVFGLDLAVCDTPLDHIRSRCPQLPTLQEVVARYGKKTHLMIEIKAEAYPRADLQNRVLADILAPLAPRSDYHLMSLVPGMFDLLPFAPPSLCIPIAQTNIARLSRLALEKKYGGIAGHYLMVSNRLLRRHQRQRQAVGTGYIGSLNCLLREVNRGVDWIFSNQAAAVQEMTRRLLGLPSPVEPL